MDQQKHRVSIPCDHSLSYLELEGVYDFYIFSDTNPPSSCDGCGNEDGFGYYCSSCDFWAHEECIDFPEIVNHPCHSRHPLKIVSTKTIDYTDGKCHFCRDELGDRMYHCSLCNLSIDIGCWVDQPLLTIYEPKSHDHTFTLMARKVSFTCNACGMAGDRNPYVCLECDFMLHQDCIYLPRVININRHEHRISRTYNLGHSYWECGVCRKKVDGAFGAFYCKRCPNYAVHSKCAVREDVWDGEELEDEPEEEEEIEDPYKIINEKEIIHFSHDQHILRLGDDDNVTGYEKMWCDACILPISFDPSFKCVQCKFFLHTVCASLPRKKRNILHSQKLTLQGSNSHSGYSECDYCLQYFDGFRYTYYPDSGGTSILLDVRCGSISEPFHHELHPHPLYRTSTEQKTCGACGKDSEYVLSCIVCEFALGMECATLPRKLKHRCDDHVLSLHHGAENSNGLLWCDICEGTTDPSVWFYGCDDCDVTLHIDCVLGNMYYLKPGNEYVGGELVLNDGMTRPICTICQKRCIIPFLLKMTNALDSTVQYVCSIDCAYRYRFTLYTL